MENWEIKKKLYKVYQDLADEFHFSCEDLEIIISSRLRSSNGHCRTGRFCSWAKITMSKALLNEFGWERFENTFRHEVAHISNRAIYHGRNHDRTFKKLCKDFGGTMNRSMAGELYKDCACDTYVQPLIRYEYHCKCGVVAKRGKRMSFKKRTMPTHFCIKCKELVMNWVEKRVG